MAVDKFSVSFDPKLAKRVRKAASKAHRSISGWLAEAAARQLYVEEGRRSLAEWEADHGPVTSRELDEIAAKWPD